MLPLHRSVDAVFHRKWPRPAAVAAMLCFCLVLGVVLGMHPVVTQVFCEGESRTVFSLTDDAQEIVELASFSLGRFDSLQLDGFDTAAADSSIRIERHSAAHPTAAVAALVRADEILNAVNSIRMRVKLEKKTKPFKVDVVCDGKKQTLKVRGGSVEEALATAGVVLGENDLVSQPLNAALRSKMLIRVQRVRYREYIKTKRIDYDTEETASDQLYVGETKIKRAGVFGERTDYYLERLVDGKLQNKLKLGSAVTKEPQTELVLVGTKTGLIPKGSVGGSGLAGRTAISRLPAALDIAVDVNGRPINYKKKLIGQATAYSGGGITSTGRSVLPGRVAVDPREIPYGTKMFIVSTDGRYLYGYAEAQDTGGFIYNSNTVVDLYMTTESACRQFGRRNVEIYILE